MSKTIFKHTALFSVFVLLAQVFGLVRDLYLTRVFGVGQLLDTYYLAFKIPDFLNIFYSVFLGSVIFIPLLTLSKNKDNQEDNRKEVQDRINTVGSLVMSLLVIFFLILYVLMPYLSKLLAPTWGESDLTLLTSLSRILLFGQFFFPVGILAGCIGMVYKKPLGMAISGFVYNICILLGAVALVPLFGIYGLVYSVLFGSVFYMLVQIYPSEVRYYFARFLFKIDLREWKNFILKNLGRFFAVVAYQIYGVVILVLAGLSGPGSVSSFSIAYNIYLAAFFVLGASFSTALMPKISEHFAKGEVVLQKQNLKRSVQYTFIVSFFVGLGLVILSPLVVKILYYYSALSESQEANISILLSMLAISFPFFNVLEVVRKYLYSTSQIFLAGSITVFMLTSVLLLTYLINILSTLGVLVALVYAMNLSLFLVTILVLSILKYKKQI